MIGMGSVTIQINGVPLLPADPKARRAAIQASAETFGRNTVAAGFNKASDMPSPAAYQRAAAAAATMMEHQTIHLDLLVNLIAEAVDTP
jgi:hypothetical protein